jgi:hypothetical protein
MSGRSFLALFLALLSTVRCYAGTEDLSFKEERQVEVAMRMIGHQVLLAVGDSSSPVFPIEKDGDRYRIRFGTEFGFNPDALTTTVDSVIAATRIAKGYIVEVVSCDSGLVVHSWEVAAIQADNMIPCRGRAQPVSSYELRITILEPDPAAFQGHGNADEASISVLGIHKDRMPMVVILAVLALVALVAVVLKRRARSGTNVDPNVVPIGEFLFDSRNMELSFRNEKVRLTSKEADLLQLLSASANNTVERDAILASVWGDEGDYVGRTLDVFISKLRKKLEADTNVRIVNVRGVGYRLVTSE